jgi:hypothetical protein
MLGDLTLVEDRKTPNRWRVVDASNSTLAVIRQSDTGLWQIFEAVDVGTPVITDHFPTRDEALDAFKQHLLSRFLRDQTKHGTTGISPDRGDGF